MEASAFVDDAAQADESSDGVRSTGKCLTDTLDELGLEANPTKSVRVTCGPAALKRKLINERLSINISIEIEPFIYQFHFMPKVSFVNVFLN